MKTYNELIKETNKKYFSLNFLLAEFEEIENLEKDIAIMDNRIECVFFETKDFHSRLYYKPISRCIKIKNDKDK